jgi:alpha-tubulin suppressor-like RCC1 family protein
MRRVAVVVLAVLAIASLPALFRANTGAGGSRHTVLVTPDGTVWTWGGNSNVQLGDGTSTDRPVPAALSSLTDVVAVAAGDLHTMVLKSDGSVWTWGYNGYGQLGDGTNVTRSQPVVVSNLSGVVAIAAGANHSVALTSNGVLHTWGQNTNGQLGDGSTTYTNAAQMVTSLSDIVAIGAGANHTLAVKNDGTVWSWGLNSNGQLGDGTTTQRTSPVQVSGVSDGAAVAGGLSHTMILLSGGTLKAAGANAWGQLGDSTTTQRTTPVAVSSLTGVTSIAAGTQSSYALKSDGSVWAWGSNTNGRLGDGTQRNAPTQATALSSIAVLAAGREHALAVTSDGVVWTWGTNTYGQLGDGTTQHRIDPIAISGPDYDWKVATPVFSVASGTYTTERTVVVTSATAGAAIHYTLNGTTPTELDASIASGASLVIDQTTTLQARAFKSGMPASNIAMATYTLSVAFIGFSPFPTTYATPQNVTLTTSSPGVTIHYTTDGTTPTEASAVYAGPIGVGTTTTIKAFGVRTGWTSSAVSTGTYMMNFGTLAAPTVDPPAGTYTTGATVTLSAMPGATIRYTTNGTSVTAGSPVYAGPLDVAATTTINARAYHPDYTTSAQTSAGYTIVVATPELSHTTGTYAAGQLIGITTATPGATLRYTLSGLAPTATDPVVPAGGVYVGNFTLKVSAWKTGCVTSTVVTATYAVSGSLAVPQVAGGNDHSLAVREDGTLWGWGANSSGQVGDGTTTQRLLPVLLGGVTGAVALDAGGVVGYFERSRFKKP